MGFGRFSQSTMGVSVRVSELFSSPIEEGLAVWVNSFESPLHLLNAVPDLFDKLTEQVVLGEVHRNAVIRGPVHVGKGSVIHAGVSIDGPVIIGENVSIRSHAQIRKGSFIGEGCVVGHSADIKASLCMDGAKIQDGTFVGESVLGCGARIGSGAILANRKFNQSEIRVDVSGGGLTGSGREFMGSIVGDYVRIGANCVLSPGTIVGPHTWVGSGAVLFGTYPGDLLITVKQELETRSKSRVALRSGRGEYEDI